jgi:hypothetical protein
MSGYNSNFQDRVLEERDGLIRHLEDLISFLEESDIFDGLDDDEKERLAAQREIMEEYLGVLEERISYFVE